MLRPPKSSVIVLRAPESSVIVLKVPQESVIMLKAPNGSNTQVPKKKRKRKATEQSDAVVRAPTHPPTTELGEDGPLPQVTWRRAKWSIANPRPPVLAPGSRPLKKLACQATEGERSRVPATGRPQEEPTPFSFLHPVAPRAPSLEPSSAQAKASIREGEGLH